MKHKFFECNCNKEHCIYCDGGLAYCVICKCAEGELTSECCGREVTEQEKKQIYIDGTLDFKEWINKSNGKNLGDVLIISHGS